MKKEMKQVLWVVALLVILMTATGNLVSAAGFDWSDGTFGNVCKKVYSVSCRSGGGASSAIYEKLEKKQKYGSMITISKVPQREVPRIVDVRISGLLTAVLPVSLEVSTTILMFTVI